MILLKGADERGFVFYTNCESAKGEELAANPKAALLFYWKSLGRQVRMRGLIEPATDAVLAEEAANGTKRLAIAAREIDPPRGAVKWAIPASSGSCLRASGLSRW